MSDPARRRIIGMVIGLAALMAVMVAITLGAEWLGYLVLPILFALMWWSYGWGWRSAALLIGVLVLAFVTTRITA